jgi:ribosomal protein S18 acetylase RimI-like enzyme
LKRLSLDQINLNLASRSWSFHPYRPQLATDNGISVPAKLQIRTATPADLISVAEIIASSFHSQRGLWGWTFPLFRFGIYEDLRHRLAPPTPHHLCLVAIDTSLTRNNSIVGTVEIGIRFGDTWASLHKCFPYLSNLAIDPVHRRHGVASSLLLSCEQISQTWGFEDLYLHVLENNCQARQLYFKLGYQVHKVESPGNMFFLNPSRQIFLHKSLK